MSASDDIRNRPFPKRGPDLRPTEETYKFPDGSICRIYLRQYNWVAIWNKKQSESDIKAGKTPEVKIATCVDLGDALAAKDGWLLEVCTEMSERARGLRS